MPQKKSLPRLLVLEISTDEVSPALKAYREAVIPARNALALQAFSITDLNRKKPRRCGDALLLQDGPLSGRTSVVLRVGDFQNYYPRATGIVWLLTALGYDVRTK